jgi:nicotinamide riboside kinase
VEWCVREGRTPRPEEQLPIAQEQERRVDEAAASADIVIADTTALMVAIYSAMLFKDGTLYRFALERQRGYDITLVTGLDLPWVADGLQRDGAHVREPVDVLVRDALAGAGIPYRTVYGRGEERVQNALAAIVAAGERGPGESRPWVWSCDKCSDPECEHRLFTGLVAGRR